MINYNEVLKIILDSSELLPKRTEAISIYDCLGRILAEDIYSDINLPPFTNSAMDGYAYKFIDGISEFKIIGEISAGNFNDFEINSGECVLITTGSKIPDSCDTVVPLEDIIIEKENIKIQKFIPKFSNLRFAGEDLKVNTLAIPKFTKIEPKHIPLLATCGKPKVQVFSKLKIGFMTSGNELVDIDTKPEMDKIRSSNQYALYSQILTAGGEPKWFGIGKDNPDVIKQKLMEMLNSDCDILISTGGVSVGKYDLLKEIMGSLKIDLKFWKTNIKPGKPICFGISDNNKIFFGLPGNPLSSFVGFEIFVGPLLRKYYEQTEVEYFTAFLQNDLKKKDGKRHFKIGIMENINGTNYVNTKLGQGSGNIYQVSKANCLVIMEEERNLIENGEKVRCIKI